MIRSIEAESCLGLERESHGSQCQGQEIISKKLIGVMTKICRICRIRTAVGLAVNIVSRVILHVFRLFGQ